MRRLHTAGLLTSTIVVASLAGGACSGGADGSGGTTGTPPSVVHPVFGPTTTPSSTPPPISGGTLIITSSGLAVAADPDRDAVYVVDLKARSVATIALQHGDEPGRVAEDGAGRVHVALRSGGAVATIDLASKSLVSRDTACVAPRGIAYDASDDSMYLACASGELVQLPAAGGAPLRTFELDRDLRDVIVHEQTVLVTRFRSAETLAVSKTDGTIQTRWSAPVGDDQRTPSVAWRTISDPIGGGVLMLHQRGAGSADAPVATSPGGYASTPPSAGVMCQTSIVETALSLSGDDMGTSLTTSPALSGAVVPVDLAVSPSRSQLAVVATGNAFTPGAQSILVFEYGAAFEPPDSNSACSFPTVTPQPPGQPVAVAFMEEGSASQLVVQTREPAALFIPESLTAIPLSKVSREDTGHDIFHSISGGNSACASCHPEGGDDGRVWSFDTEGARRTPSLKGTVQGTAPYHWAGEMKDFPDLVDQVFHSRMNGPALADDQVSALSSFVNRIPAPRAPAPLDAASAARGQTLFEGSAGCAACHDGAKFTNNDTVNVGTGEAFQVPSLIGVGYRAPFLHDGCAASLTDRFDPSCGGTLHGNTANLGDQDFTDLAAYLGTL